ncbi:hypothetical protein G0U57_001725 [Chelydra serpentina]|uniref:Uncharacterized protein n=1 Tax=Chelydra serpentina TaxID=8475 RepID=A0A8T1SSF5_CHESE|nr:hypothetical protein G0U57_001725 [Chelydra serpentina]
MPTDAKKTELPVGAPACVQKRRPIYTYFAKEADPLLNPVFHPEIELKKQRLYGVTASCKRGKGSHAKKCVAGFGGSRLKGGGRNGRRVCIRRHGNRGTAGR